MSTQIRRSPGSCKVVGKAFVVTLIILANCLHLVCGQPEFSGIIRGYVLNLMREYKHVRFAETEYQPQVLEPLLSPHSAFTDRDLESDPSSIIKKAERPNRLRRTTTCRTVSYPMKVISNEREDDQVQLVKSQDSLVLTKKLIEQEATACGLGSDQNAVKEREIL
jgi:hypothetical protein